MSGRLPSLRGEAVIRALKKAGFNVVRIKGSHHILEQTDDPARRTVVPVHAGHGAATAHTLLCEFPGEPLCIKARACDRGTSWR